MTVKPRIAIPIPTSGDAAYNARSWNNYAQAVEQAGGEPVEVPLTAFPDEIARIATSCQDILLPGSPADVNPQKYGQEPVPECAPPDHARENVDELLLQDAHNLHKPLLGICFGVQSLNVWRGGTLIQDLAPVPVNHAAGSKVAVAHAISVAPDSMLGGIITPAEAPEKDGFLRLPINTSHHQSIGIPGDGLKIVARSPEDAVIEAVEGGQHPGHFVLGVQWHPERSTEISPSSRAIFTRFVQEAAQWHPRKIEESVA